MRKVLVGLLGLLVAGLLFSTALAQDTTPTAVATPDILVDYILKDSPTECDDIGRMIPGSGAVDLSDLTYSACASNGLQAQAMCEVHADTVLFDTVTIDCSMWLTNTSSTPINIMMTNLQLVTESGRTYPPRRVGFADKDDAPLTKDEPYGKRGWAFDVDIPHDTHLPALLVLTMDGGVQVRFIIETLSTPTS